ncbi:LuxR C-terminal-related transcriptional regulator [Novosphingobium beihaiensis]|uniref:LuxR C-terminal-related transcriptional regulator n=1 Tax=Novosphingobium beihaiensis TaxID=2930389 RepID=UPI001FBC109E|nr:response regulator transcription factor [Novosphingobium beihaiensis]
MGTSVSIVNQSPISREGLRRILSEGDITIFASVSCVDELGEIDSGCEHVVLLDMVTSSEQVASLKSLLDRDRHFKAVVLVEKFDYGAMIECFNHGAQGYVVKDMSCDALIALIQLAALGHKVMPPDVIDQLPQRETPRGPLEQEADPAVIESNLSLREQDVLSCLMAGYSNKRIARSLDLSEATVKVHVKAILRKLKVMNRTQAAIWATSRGLPSRGNLA